MTTTPLRRAKRECKRKGHQKPKDTGHGFVMCAHCGDFIIPVKAEPEGREVPDLDAFQVQPTKRAGTP